MKNICTILAGINGVGKTTLALKLLEQYPELGYFINVDLIAAGLSPQNVEGQQVRAGRIFLQQMQMCIKQKQNFIFETTLSGKSYAKLITELQSTHWRVDLVYLYLASIQESFKRVAERVRHGGHDIPEATIKRRYPKSLHNLMHLYTPLCDNVYCFENGASGTRKNIFIKTEDNTIVYNQATYQKLQEVL